MSDDEDIQYVKRQRLLHYGSLEETERKRQQQNESPVSSTSQGSGELEDIDSDEDYDEPKKSKRDTGSPPPQPSGATLATALDEELFDIEKEVAKDKIALLEEFERKKRARQITVPTDDGEVKQNLRSLNEPICYFGEGPAERRRRLRDLLASLGENAIKTKQQEEEERKALQKEQESTWYHEGPEALRLARLWIANYSLPRAKERLENAQSLLDNPSSNRAGQTVELQKRLQAMAPIASQVGDIRPLSSVAISNDSTMLLSASWSGLCKLWSVPDCKLLRTYRGHASYVGGVAFRPGITSDETGIAAMATGAHDGAVKLWSFDSDESVADITGHMPHRVSKLVFHPSGRFLGTACYDNSWRLWDLEQRMEVLHQEGHAKPVHCIAFQCDGSVVATGGLDAFGRIWDLRTGRCIMFLESHLGSVFGVDFSPNGFHVATGSQDNTCKIWDLRRRQPIYTIPAHTNLVSNICYQKEHGNFLVTSSYDCTVKIWSNKTWQPLKTLQGHDNKVTCADIAPNSKIVVTSSFDRTFKLWAPEI